MPDVMDDRHEPRPDDFGPEFSPPSPTDELARAVTAALDEQAVQSRRRRPIALAGAADPDGPAFVVVCSDGAAFVTVIDGNDPSWIPLPPVPGCELEEVAPWSRL